MGVLLQAFYWDCAQTENAVSGWWNRLARAVPDIAQAGFTALWLPPASKAANLGGLSMGYDVYDYFDLGEFDQKGSVPTLFGTRGELQALVRAIHDNGMTAYADLVLNHNSGADSQERNPIVDQDLWTRFSPKSGKFPRDWTCFNPSPYPDSDPGRFGDMPDLCHTNPRVMAGILEHARWMVEDVGFDGFRFDFVKGFGGWIVRSIFERRYARDGKPVELYGVGECWDEDRFIDNWLDSVNKWSDHRVGAFDFPLRYRLKDLCDKPGFSLRDLAAKGVLMTERPFEAVTFVDNHDFRDPGGEIVSDKMLAYSVICTHEGYPCVFWKDYFVYNLAEPGGPSGIERLVKVHEKHAAGSTSQLWVDDTFYAMERAGDEGKSGLVYALNNSDAPRQVRIHSGFAGSNLVPVAWRGERSLEKPPVLHPNADGWCDVWAPQRGYAVYAPG